MKITLPILAVIGNDNIQRNYCSFCGTRINESKLWKARHIVEHLRTKTDWVDSMTINKYEGRD